MRKQKQVNISVPIPLMDLHKTYTQIMRDFGNPMTRDYRMT